MPGNAESGGGSSKGIANPPETSRSPESVWLNAGDSSEKQTCTAATLSRSAIDIIRMRLRGEFRGGVADPSLPIQISAFLSYIPITGSVPKQSSILSVRGHRDRGSATDFGLFLNLLSAGMQRAVRKAKPAIEASCSERATKRTARI
ncbi:hypothetical protein chiPu_0004806 [Chiloscyllium punctatum]|uniref:Uncharacterized protein n=1 Tax=Chiloscyllium punctatum TaxID=137246 RepID=A0A401S7S7_CHIPU|nr:hypothetical protein [Chiloscyllium punctatum]